MSENVLAVPTAAGLAHRSDRLQARVPRLQQPSIPPQPSECDDGIKRAHVSRKQRAAGYRPERSLLDCVAPCFTETKQSISNLEQILGC